MHCSYDGDTFAMKAIGKHLKGRVLITVCNII